MILSKVSIYCIIVIRELYREKKVGKSSILVIPTMWFFQKQVKCKFDTFRFQIYGFNINVSFQYYCFRDHDFYNMRKSDTFRIHIHDFVIKTAQLYTYSNVVAALQACAVSFRYYCYRNDDVYKNTAQLCTYRAVLTCHFNYGYMIMSKTCNSSIIAFGKTILSTMCHFGMYCIRNDAFVNNVSFLYILFPK